MAQTGFTPIQLYRSVTAATAPLAADLAAGELALNTTDEKLYFKNTGGTAKILANAAIAGIIPGTGVATALAVNVGSAGAPVINGGALGTPSSGTLTNATGLPAAGVTGTALVAAAIGTTVQAYDADLTTWAGITPGTGIGTALAVAVGTDGAPVIKSGALGTPSSGTVTNLTGTASININGTVGATTPTTGAFTSINGVTTDTTTNKPVTAASLAGGTLPASVTTLAASSSIVSGSASLSASTFSANSLFHTAANKNITLRTGIRLTGACIQGIQDDAATDAPIELFTGSAAQQYEAGSFTWLQSGVTKMTLASGGAVTIPGTLSLTGASSTLGYGTGSGGTVTQASTSGKSTTTPACDHGTGQITTDNASLSNNTTVFFNVPNSVVTAKDTIVLSFGGFTGNGYNYQCWAFAIAAGSFYIALRNVHGSTALGESVVINFTVIKGA